MKRNIFKVFLNKFFEYPLWIKQAIYFEMWNDMRKNLCEESVLNRAENIFALHVPTLTFEGRNELLNKSFCYDSNVYNFLKFVSSGYSLVEISLNMFLSMEEISKLYLMCLNQKFIETPHENEIVSLAGYIAGKYLTGEYFLNNGSITQEQLDETISEQQNSNSIGNSKFIGQILVDKGYITNETLSVALAIKSDAANRFVANPEIIPYSKPEVSENAILKRQIADLKNENKLLKSTMAKIIDTVKNNDF